MDLQDSGDQSGNAVQDHTEIENVNAGEDLSLLDEYLELQYLVDDSDSQSDPLQLKQQGTDWLKVFQVTGTLLERSVDLNLLSWKLRASYHVKRGGDIAASLRQLVDCLENYGTALHPRGEDETETRHLHSAALMWIGAEAGVEEFLGAKLIDQSAATVAELISEGEPEAIANEDEAKAARPPATVIAGIDSSTRLELIGLLQQMVSDFKRIGSFNSNEQVIGRIDTDRIVTLLDSIISKLSVGVDRGAQSRGIPMADAVVDSQNFSQSAGAEAFPSKLCTRDDAMSAIDRVIDYFHEYEPSHPAPALLLRSKKLIGMGFEEIVAELLPASVEQFKQLSGNE